ncbi:variable surface protein [Plasmodium gonderi]|uniref:Variable surface protein n=1 Tax=Plasmodium gonderi TaxID=77519 RepID=A0A1Y1JNT9_PLAGO|nr:variable surface protein [Plasmodium gonderi]GAW84256.1 variable surface protein [Plasmodium gonderi]
MDSPSINITFTVLRYPKIEECYLDYAIPTKNDWKMRKKLYEYYVDFNYLSSMVSKENNNCTVLLNFINDKADIYSNFKDLCLNMKTNQCPIVVENYNDYDPKNLVHKLKCYEPVVDRNFKGTTFSEEKKGVDLFVGQEMHPSIQEQLEHELRTTITVHESQLRDNSYTSLKIIGNSILAVVLTFIGFGVLYKLTPVGRQLLNNTIKLRNMISNLNGQNHRNINYTLESFNSFYDHANEEYRGYNPV